MQFAFDYKYLEVYARTALVYKEMIISSIQKMSGHIFPVSSVFN